MEFEAVHPFNRYAGGDGFWVIGILNATRQSPFGIADFFK
jgi:hypothetical protein